ncbi:alpha/beta-hydrolase [Punctularia strigosozonata HHB-11173 SS5]|uniref:alpha/beta-hydrolase n=1 Tax=Punctularia strigosozonata (strain HHB-11173) TaxID=741275 RepID=UPI00044177C8|nr:alpha/beta-hydrolase [Punctularia strigosozonata HHB-11173 SS5]EIN06264.1 alpha/beta-hydrolase [Punctularia strigosozonata HHB-11173 SS5]
MAPSLLALCLPLASALLSTAIPLKLEKRASVTALSSSQISAFKPFSFFASAGYCDPSATLAWTCGANCDANPGFVPVASGGDGSKEQFWFVGFDPAHDTVIVSHQGTDPSAIIPLVTDSEFFLGELDSTLFPGIDSSIKVHDGFRDAQQKSASDVLAAVKKTMSAHGTTSVTMVGHSLGAAIALIDSVFLPLHLPSSTTFRVIGYGMPRVGNQEFADYIDSHNGVTHINNKEDEVPILPGRFLGFHHPSGELHIQDSESWLSCPGQDNTDDECTTGDVGNVFEGDLDDHDGPYDGVVMGC